MLEINIEFARMEVGVVRTEVDSTRIERYLVKSPIDLSDRVVGIEVSRNGRDNRVEIEYVRGRK